MEKISHITQDININFYRKIITPKKLQKIVPIKDESINTVLFSRKNICHILNGEDKRKFIIVGPCSIHDTDAAIEYAKELLELSYKVEDTLILVMRTYFEKPRTTVGWKGFINDPRLDNSCDINEGLLRARMLLSKVTQMGLSVATEALDPITPPYLFDFISWAAIGARTTESQTHREMSSGLSAPVGFKNNTDGNIDVAINAIKSALKSHHFLGIDNNGQTSIIETSGNKYGHLILRGGRSGPNYDSASLQLARESLIKNSLNFRIVVDCSHDNSLKDYKNQPQVFFDCIAQIERGNNDLVGFMIESNLQEGSQAVSENMAYGVSITDGCINFATTKEIILSAHERLKKSL